MTQEDRNKWIREVLITWVVALAAILLSRECEHRKEISNFKTTQKALEDTIKVTRNKLGQSVGTTSVIQTSNTNDFLALASRDSTILKLQKLVKEYKSKLKGQGVALVVNSEGTIKTTVPTVVDTTDTISPIYNSEYKLKDSLGKVWVWGNTIARKDSTKVFLKYTEEAELLIVEEKTGFLGLGKPNPFAQITFKNPYNEVKEMKVYQKIKPNTKYWHIGPGVFYGINSDLKPQFFVGAGIMWTRIQF